MRALLLLALGGCATPAARDVGAVLDDWHDAASKADERRYFGHLAEHSVFLGTDSTERWDKAAFRAYAHPHFAAGKAWSFHPRRRTVTFDSAAIAHFDEDLDTQNLGPARGSGVLARTGGGWKIVQYNLSLTVPNARFAVTKEAASTAVVQSGGGDLAFLSGAWVAEHAGETIEEQWTVPRAGSQLGVGRATKDGKTTFFELLRIEGDVLFAQPRGGVATEFRRTDHVPSRVTFENAAHDWPKRISYRAEAGNLHVRVAGAPGQRVEEYVMQPAVLERGR